MKKNFKKIMSVLLIAMMLCSIFSITASAKVCTITLAGGKRGVGANATEGTLNEMIMSIEGDTYTDANGVVYTINKDKNTITFTTDASGKFVFPEFFFEMPGYEQYAWVTKNNSNSGTKKYPGDSGSVKKNTTYYGGYEQLKYDINFLPGADGVGEPVSIVGKTHNSKIDLEGAIFTRAGYVQIGWATTENAAAVEYELSEKEYIVEKTVDFYPVWQKAILSVKHDINRAVFGSLCVDYTTPDAQTLNITNNSNSAVTVTLPTSSSFSIVAADSTTIPANGGTLAVSIQPKAGLSVGKYTETLAFDFGNEEINFAISVKFVVNDHLFVTYVSNNDATYSANGTETAECFSGCGAKHTRDAAGSMKVYSADNNTADGLLEEYLYHKSVKFVAYGSGMDATEADNLSNRFRPTEWFVEGTSFKGTFDENTTDYTVKYDHGDGNFGTYTLTIKYVEEQKDADGKWVATDVEDVKTFEYSIGPSEKDNQEVVRPNMIVSIIFGLMGYLVDLITSGSLF